MKIKIIKTKILALTIMVILISGLLSTYSGVFARSNWAYAAGLKYDIPDNIFDMDPTNQCVNALNAYQNAGFSVGGHINPTKQILWENLYATVQYFNGHGNVDLLLLGNTGIINGADRTMNVTTDNGKKTFENVQFIGTNTVHWDADTDLVSYLACNTAGVNNSVASDSLARSTCYRGATVVFGYTSEVHTVSLGSWSDRYNEKLGQGYGVNDALLYANSFNYLFNDVKNGTLWHHGNANLKIGKYNPATKNSLSETNNTLNKDDLTNDRLVYSSNGINTSKVYSSSNVESKLSEIYKNFDRNNYIVEKNTSYCYDINTNLPTEENVYYDYKLKIGDYITNAGYTVKLKNGVISEIYDNNIDLDKQEELLEKSYNFNANISKENISMYKSDLNKRVTAKYNNKIEVIGNESIFYYDIENNKKYVVISCESEIEIDGEKGGKSIDSVMYEIK